MNAAQPSPVRTADPPAPTVAAGDCAPEASVRRRPSPSLVWAITAGEGSLWALAAWFFADYWLMLPVRYRWIGGLLLTGSAVVGLSRLACYYRRRQNHEPPSRNL